MRLLIVICNRNLSKMVFNILNEESINFHLSFYGKGTADHSILTYFGLEKSEKEIIFATINKQNIKTVLAKLSTYEFIKHHGAVAFTIPIDGISQQTMDYVFHTEGINGKR